MKEYKSVLIIVFILFFLGIVSVQFSNYSPSEFNFYKSELIISENQINEKLYYSPDQDYHTLYRNFVDPISTSESNSIQINSVSCSEGKSYFRSKLDCYDGNKTEIPCYPYTEENEYGCANDGEYGFFKGENYFIEANYSLNPENVFNVDGKNYTKFVVYSPRNHYRLTSDNFVVNSALEIVKKEKYEPKENVIVYIPTQNTEGKNVIYLEDFEFDNSSNFWIYVFAFFPGLIFFFVWVFFGRENLEADIPGELSVFPDEKKKRKIWEVANYFSLPFSMLGDNFFASILLNFYHKKIIDIKEINKEIFIKINQKFKYEFDEIESQVFEMLKSINKKCSEKNRPGEYFNFKKAQSETFNFQLSSDLREKGKNLRKEIKEKEKNYLNRTGEGILMLFSIIFLISVFAFQMISLIPLGFIFLMVCFFSILTSTIFTKYIGEFYLEYRHWQSFREYLKHSFSIREGNHKTVVMWDEYLIYATALGVPDRVIKELKANNLITAEQERIYHGIYLNSGFMSGSTGSSGHGGAGAGGVGGGGGGGR